MQTTPWSINFLRAYGMPPITANFRTVPEDFCVTEIVSAPLHGEGEHYCLWIRKRGENTRWVAKLLADFFKVDEQAIGYYGLKDRHAETSQWFSVHLPGVKPTTVPNPDEILLGEEIKVLAHGWHNRKFRRGDHDANQFEIRLRNITGERQALESRLQQVVNGVPNYFGEQRFGIDGQNLLHAEQLLAKKVAEQQRATTNKSRRRQKGRREGLYLSAARSYVFNRVLEERVKQNIWSTSLPGEATPQGPLWGRGRSPAVESVRLFEEPLLDEHKLWCQGLEFSGLQQQRRDLVLIPSDFSWQFEGDDLTLSFQLLPGAFATSVLREIAHLNSPPAKEVVL